MATAKPKVLDPVKDFDTPVKRQEDLPGMENRGIPELEEAARKYAAIRDKRMALNDAEVKLQDILMALLKKHGKREYKHDGIEIWIKVEEEKVKVRVSEEDEPPSEKEKNAVRDEANTSRKNRKNKGEDQGSPGASHENQPANQETGNETGATRELSEEDEPPF